jgi:hypothetical protein
MKSGPDVFADALVPKTPHPAFRKTPHEALDAGVGRFGFFKSLTFCFSPPAASPPEGCTLAPIVTDDARCHRRHWTSRRRRQPLVLRPPDCRQWLSFREMAG